MPSVKTTITEDAFLRYKQSLTETELFIEAIRLNRERREKMYLQNKLPVIAYAKKVGVKNK